VIAIAIDKYNLFQVTLPVSTEKGVRLLLSENLLGFQLRDHDGYLPDFDEETPEDDGRTWAWYETPASWYQSGIDGFSVRRADDGFEVVVSGWVLPEGDDAFDHTVEHKELSLTNRLGVASLLRQVLN
jgi:hypothetical protein